MKIKNDKNANSDEDGGNIATNTYMSPSTHKHILSFYTFSICFLSKAMRGVKVAEHAGRICNQAYVSASLWEPTCAV